MQNDDMIYIANLIIGLQETQKETAADIKRLKAELFPQVENEGGQWSGGEATARITTRKGSTFYDVKALEALRKSMPKIAKILEPHRGKRADSTFIVVRREKI